MSYELLDATNGTDFSAEDCERIQSAKSQDFYAEPHDHLAKLSWFLHGAFGHNTDVRPKHLPISTVSDDILSRLNTDIRAYWLTAKLDECPYGMDIRLIFGNEYKEPICVLKMAWRID